METLSPFRAVEPACHVAMLVANEWTACTELDVRQTMFTPGRVHVTCSVRRDAVNVHLRATKTRTLGWRWRVVSSMEHTTIRLAARLVGDAGATLARDFVQAVGVGQ